MISSASTFALALLAVLVVVNASERPQPDSIENVERKLEDISNSKRPSFFVGSRYGRSSQYYGNPKAGRVNVAPRNDRFFLGSRYGKRTNEFMPAVYEQESNPSNESKFFTMSCVHTGFKNFFRCNSVNDLDNYIQHLTNDDK